MAECADSLKIIDIMNCPICLERYSKPKYLPCLHTFCEGCILTYVTSLLEKLDGKEHINCPVCRTTVQLPTKECTPKDFVDGIPANVLIIGLLEKEKITRLEKPCMSCERLDITSKASVICIDCSDTLCDTCQKYHRANKATYDHDMRPVSQLLPDDNILPKAFKNICTKHSKTMKLFCSTHSVPCCLLCLTNDHRTCAGNNIISVEEAADIYCSSVKFDCLKIDLKNVSDDLDTLSSHYSQCFKDIETQYASKLRSIENTCSSLIAKMKDLEITRKTQLAKIFDERKDAIETQMIACENHRKSIDNEKQVIETSIEKATSVQVMIEAHKIISKVEHHKRFLADSSSKHNFKYTITVDDGNDLAKSVEKFVYRMCSISCDCVKVTLNLVNDLREDGYEKMFCQRAKLFRFDKETNQWKERGLGEMKILRHLVNSRYRLILRREQVLKLACNQWLTAELSFKPLPTTETSWCWVGQDFSDNELVIEQLAIKFKTRELSQQFKQVIDTCQNDIRKQKSTATEKGYDDIKPTNIVAPPEDSRPGLTQPEDAMKNVFDEQVKEEEEEDDEDDDDEEYTTVEGKEQEILLVKKIEFFSKEEDWKAVGLGTIKVIYDEDVNGYRIMVELDNKHVVCNNLVTKELNMSIDKKDCYWSPIDFSTDEPVRRHFRSQFSSDRAAQEFEKVIEEGRTVSTGIRNIRKRHSNFP